MSGASLIFWKNIDLLYKAIEALRKVGADEDFFRDIAEIEEIAEKVVNFVHNSENHAIYELEIGESCEGALIAPMDLDASYKALIALRNKGADKKFFEKIAKRKDLAHEVVDFLHRSVNNVVYEFEVNYNYCLGEMIKAGGYKADKNIKACHFPIKGQGVKVVKAVLLHFNSDKERTTLEEARNATDSEGCRFARIEELIAFGKAYPSIQKCFPIVAVGSMWDNPVNSARCVPALWADKSHNDRCLYLCPCVRGWGKNYRFLAVRN